MPEVICPKCGTKVARIQGSREFPESVPAFPRGSLYVCPSCGAEFSLKEAELRTTREDMYELYLAIGLLLAVVVGLIVWKYLL